MSSITKLYLLNVPLEADYKHTLYFDSNYLQEEYFTDHAVSNCKWTNFSYQMKDNKIRVPKHFDEINGKVNYVMYQNLAYTDKWFYAFIIDMKYINDGVTELQIKTDVIQTWREEYSLKSCFVEREHTDDDTIGKNTLPEGLETGEYICNYHFYDDSTSATCFVIASTINIVDGTDSGITIYNGIINGWHYYAFDSIEEVKKVLTDVSKLRTNDSIVSMFIMPKKYMPDIYSETHKVQETHEVEKTNYWTISDGDGGRSYPQKPNKVDGYKPHNNKLLTYPYSYLLIDNNAGASAIYKYELFEGNSDIQFVIYGCIAQGGSIKLVPMYYNGVGQNHHFSLNAGKYPVCGWQSDYYTNWLTQNALNIEVQTESILLSGLQTGLGNVMQAVGGVVSLDLDNALKGTTDALFTGAQVQNQIKGITAQKEIHSFQSPTTRGNTVTGDINYCLGNIRFTGYQMSVKEEYARIIDNYFSMYGYQTNRVKVPNSNHRPRYWYTKTVGCEIDGSIPNKDMQEIKKCYDSGITFWKNPEHIGIYTNSAHELYDNEP